MPQCDNPQTSKPRLSNDRVWPKPNNLKERGVPQYQRCIKLLGCSIKQATTYIVAKRKQCIIIKVLISININLFISQINSLSIDLKHKAQQMYITVQQEND